MPTSMVVVLDSIAAARPALSGAVQQSWRAIELRASMSLARLWRDQGKPQQARELLAPVYGWFTEGFEARDLNDAKALLEELAA
jgi:predicted ATPase